MPVVTPIRSEGGPRAYRCNIRRFGDESFRKTANRAAAILKHATEALDVLEHDVLRTRPGEQYPLIGNGQPVRLELDLRTLFTPQVASAAAQLRGSGDQERLEAVTCERR